MSERTPLAPLVKIGWRSIRKAPGRSLLIFVLVALVVAAGTFAAVVSRSTTASDADLRASEFGAGNFRADFSSGFIGRSGPLYVPEVGAAPLPPLPTPQTVPLPSGQFDELSEQAAERRAEQLAWLAEFDLPAAEQEIGDALGVPVSITRSGFGSVASGPFGSRGVAVGAITDLDSTEPSNAGTVRFVQGRAPSADGEIALPARSGRDVPEIGDEISVSDQQLTVVGYVTGPANRFQTPALVTTRTFDRLVGVENDVNFAVRAMLPNDPATANNAATIVSELIGRPVSARTPDFLIVRGSSGWDTYPYDNFDWVGGGASVPRIVPILITGLLAVQIALVCAAAFAVGIRRRTKEFGQLMTLGADDRHVRRLAQIEAGLLGIGASILGLIIGVIASRFAINAGWLDSAGDRIPDGVRWSLVDWIGPASIGIAAVVLAAWWPARALRNAAIPGVLEGRLPSVAVRGLMPVRGLLLAGAGIGFVYLGSQQVNRGTGDGAPFALLLLGVVAMIGGSLMLIGTLLSLIGQRADQLPLLARLAARNSDRQRSRSWVVVGAFIAALAVPVMIGASIKAYPNSYQSTERNELTGRLITTSRVTVGPDGEFDADLRDDLTDFDADFGRGIDEITPIEGQVPHVAAPGAQPTWRQSQGRAFYGGGRVLVATDELVDLLDLDAELVDALARGAAIDVSMAGFNHGTGTGTTELAIGQFGAALQSRAPITVIDGPDFMNGTTWLISESTLQDRGATPVALGTVRLLKAPLTTANEEAIRQIGNRLWIERYGAFGAPWESDNPQPWLDLSTNRIYFQGVSQTNVRLWSTLAATGLAMLVAFVTASLSAVEMTKEIESMIATGAAPSIRRRLLGAQTLYHLVVAALMAVPLAVLAFWAVTRADTNSGHGLIIPWSSIAIALVLIPLVVAVAVALTFRNGKPAISRRMS